MMTETLAQFSYCSGIARQLLLRLLAVAFDDSSANGPSTRLVNTATWNFGAYEIATK